jgi:hypothetical protein
MSGVSVEGNFDINRERKEREKERERERGEREREMMCFATAGQRAREIN